MLLTILQLQSFRAFSQPQVIWDVDLTTNNSAPLADCTCTNLTFELEQAWLDDEPMTGITLDLFLLDGKYTFCNDPGFVQGADTTIAGIGTCDRFTLTGVSIPSINEGGTATITVYVQVVGFIDDPDPSVAYRATFGSDVIFDNGPAIIPEYQVINVGVDDTSTNLSVVAIGGTGNLALPPGGTGQDVLIQGTLIVNVDYDFTGLSDIYMAPGASIVIEDGNTLRLLDKTYVRGCDAVWDGIFVEDGGLLRVDGSTDQSPDKVIIQGAENGIIAENGSNVFVKDALLRNNGTGILVPTATSGFNYVDLSVRTSAFETDSQFPGPVMITGVQANHMFTPLQSAENTFSNLTWGIYGLRSNVVSDRDYFEYCTSAGISMSGPSTTLTQTRKGLNEANPTFSHCYTGIQVQDINIVSKNNVMLDMRQGYSLRKGIFRKANIEDNIIRASRQGIAVNTWYSYNFLLEDNEIHVDGEPVYGAGIFTEMLTGTKTGICLMSGNDVTVNLARHGIYLNSTDKATLRNNNVLLETAMSNFGIQLDNTNRSNIFCNLVEGTAADDGQGGITFSTTSLNTVACNTLETTGRGIHYLGENVPTTMRGNEFNSHFRAVQYGWPSASFPIGAQTGIQSHHGNRWLEVYQSGDYGVGHYGTQQQIQNSQVIYDSNDEPDPQNPSLTTNEDPGQPASLFTQIGGVTYLCSNETTGCPPPTFQFTDGITPADLNTAKGRTDPGYFREPQIWVAKRQLYRRLLEDTTLLSADTLIANFYTAESSTSVGVYENLRRDIEDLFVPAPADESQLEEYQDSLLVRMAELQSVEEMLDSNLTQQQKDTLLTEKQGLLQAILSITGDYSDLSDTLERVRITVAEQILTDNATAPDDESFEKFQRTVNRVMLEYIIDKQTALTDSQAIALAPIANTCPFTGGPAVYQARALLGNGAAYADDSLCYVAPQPLRKPKQPDQAIDFRIFPNPSNGYTVLELGQQLEEEGEVWLTNAIGIQVHRQKVNKGDQTVYLIFDEIPAGFYYLTLRTSSTSATKIFTNIK